MIEGATPVRDWLRPLVEGVEAGAYAGVGARATPEAVLARMRLIAAYLARRRWTLRSGGARGADAAFEAGARGIGPCEIYLPSERWRGHPSPLFPPSQAAIALAEQFHPAWRALNPDDRLLMGRNSHQVLGEDLKSPVSFLLCWTPDGANGRDRPTSRKTGGTGQAIRIAVAHGIPVLNLGQLPSLRSVQ